MNSLHWSSVFIRNTVALVRHGTFESGIQTDTDSGKILHFEIEMLLHDWSTDPDVVLLSSMLVLEVMILEVRLKVSLAACL